MGGPGSGIWQRRHKKGTVEDYHLLDVRVLYRKGWLRSGMEGRWCWLREGQEVAAIGWKVEKVWVEGDDLAEAVELCYTVTSPAGDSEDLHYEVALDWTRCNYGRHRPWFICPGMVNNVPCIQRVAILYGGRYFLCRSCYRLSYESQRKDRSGRLKCKAQNIRIRLGGTANLTEKFPSKPKGMHLRTYQRMRQEAEGCALLLGAPGFSYPLRELNTVV